MTVTSARLPRRTDLARMEDARRATQRQLDLIERRIARRLAVAARHRRRRSEGRRRGRPPDRRTSRRRHHEMLAVLVAERQPETDDLTIQLLLQDLAIRELRERAGFARPAA